MLEGPADQLTASCISRIHLNTRYLIKAAATKISTNRTSPQPITIGLTTLEEVSYGWRQLDDVRY